MACEDLQKKFDAAVQRSEYLAKQLQDPTLKDPAEKANLKKASQAAGAVQFAARQALSDCQLRSGLIQPTPAAPARILETDYGNPKFTPPNPNWNLDFRKSVTIPPVIGKTVTGFPYFGKEWTQVLAPGEEYDSPATMVAASGWIINPGLSQSDVPFDHPFGDKPFEFDYEFQLATDVKYHGLLGPGNKGDGSKPEGSDLFAEFLNERQAEALKPATGDTLDTSMGLLGIEWETHNIPRTFQDNIRNGDRTVVAGRWIVDCGHDIARTEIHPPLLMACASPLDADTTRVIFTSRPYLVGQTFTTDFPSIYVDGQNDDGEFMVHMLKELGKANANLAGIIPLPLSLSVEAHPKIKSRPFKGNPQVRFIIRPSSLQNPPATAGPAVHRRRLAVSFQFTVRSGVSVQITNPEADRVDVVITMNEAAYKPPSLPTCNHKRTYSKNDLVQLDSELGSAIFDIEAVSAVAQFLHGFPNPVTGLFSAAVVGTILGQGITTDHYDPLDDRVNVLDSSHQAVDTFGSPVAGIVHDDSQPFPVFGWIQAKWVDATLSVHQ